MLKKLGIAVVVLVALLGLFAVVVAVQPADFRIERSTSIAAPPETVFGLVNDFHQWEQWSPWAKLDPSMKTTYAGPASGKDSSYAWEGNDQVGEGKMTITESRPNELVQIELAFLRPFEATNQTEFKFAAEEGGTKVTWTMYGANGFVAKAFSLLMDMDAMVGTDFENGLSSMKPVAEAGA